MHIAVNDESIVNEESFSQTPFIFFKSHIKSFDKFAKTLHLLGMSLSKVEISTYGRNKVVGAVSIAK